MQPTLKDQRWPGPSCACVSCFKPVAFLPMPSQDRHSWVDGNSAKLRKRSLHFRWVVTVGSGLFSIVSVEKSRNWWHQDTVVARAVTDVNPMFPHASFCYPCPQERKYWAWWNEKAFLWVWTEQCQNFFGGVRNVSPFTAMRIAQRTSQSQPHQFLHHLCHLGLYIGFLDLLHLLPC